MIDEHWIEKKWQSYANAYGFFVLFRSNIAFHHVLFNFIFSIWTPVLLFTNNNDYIDINHNLTLFYCFTIIKLDIFCFHYINPDHHSCRECVFRINYWNQWSFILVIFIFFFEFWINSIDDMIDLRIRLRLIWQFRIVIIMTRFYERWKKFSL